MVEDGKCTKGFVVGSMPDYGVSSNAKYESSEYIGSSLPNLGVLVNEFYNIDRSTEDIYLSSYAPVAGDICIPVLVSELKTKPFLEMDLQ